MVHLKRGSKTIEKAERRLTGLRSIDSNLDFGEGLHLTGYEVAITTARQKIADYNTALSLLAQLRNDAIAAEEVVKDLSERMFSGVLSKYGRNSNEYEMAGGKAKTKKRRLVATAPNTEPVTIERLSRRQTKATQNGKNAN